ncbi:MAG: hypothetical protein Q7O66_22280 [Dehalococcoidia bacterium]|nr:hypothetical protein [Dehalococcoidia bacterium]
MQGVDTHKVSSEGQIVVNQSPDMASWSDLFRGEETRNTAGLDLAKVQMFFFTMILAIAYAVALGAVFKTANAGQITAFPPLSPAMVSLLGISNAGYLVNKSISTSQTA